MSNSNQYIHLARSLEALADEFDRRDLTSTDGDGDALREAALRLRSQPCQHQPEYPAKTNRLGQDYCRWCGILLQATWSPAE